MDIAYLPSGWALKKIREWLADGETKDTCVRELMVRTGKSADTVERVLGHMQSVNELVLNSSYPGHHAFEDRFEIRAVAPPKK
jgi:hypothetical protein